MRIVITGAAGPVGRAVVEELAADHQLCLIDKTPLAKQPSIVADLAQDTEKSYWKPWQTRRCCWRQAFEKTDVVVHLAAEADPEAAWDSVLANNIQATWNVIETAARYGVPRVIFASSNWVVKPIERSLAPSCYQPDGPKIGSDVAPCPINPYGLSKAYGELAGRMFVDNQKLQSFVAVRIGYYGPMTSNQELLRLWIGADDIRRLFRRCIEAEFRGFHIVYGVSAQKMAPYDLSHTTELLSWFPSQVPEDHAPALNPA